MTYGTERLLEEVSYVAYHFGWSLAEILDLEHPLRQAFVAQIGRINERLAEAPPDPAGATGVTGAAMAVGSGDPRAGW